MKLIQDIRPPQKSANSAQPLPVVQRLRAVEKQPQINDLPVSPLPSQAPVQKLRLPIPAYGMYCLITIGVLLVTLNFTIGQLLIGIYALIGLLFRIRSRYTFFALLIIIISIPVLYKLDQSILAETAAVYGYELFVLGLLQAIIETWLTHKSKHNSK